jgi:hypothetical protein
MQQRSPESPHIKAQHPVLDFVFSQRTRQCSEPNRVHHFCLHYGLAVRFRLLSTPFLNDAVAFRFGPPV